MATSKGTVLKRIALVFLVVYVGAQFYMPKIGKSYVIPESFCSSGSLSFIDSQNSTCSDSSDQGVGFPLIVNQQEASSMNMALSVLIDLVPLIILVAASFMPYKLSKNKA